MIESMSLTVAPWDEQGAINDFQAFGWHLSTSQEVYDNSVKFERRYGDLYQVTSTTNYVKLLFQRDKNMPNYAKICELEELYFNAKKVMGYNSVSIIPGKILTIIILFSIIAGIGNIWGESDYQQGIFLIALGLGIYLLRFFIYYMPKHKKAEKARIVAIQALDEVKTLL